MSFATESSQEEDHDTSVIDLVEEIAEEKEWTIQRGGPYDISLHVNGRWADYQVSFQWMPEIEILHMGYAFDLKVPPLRMEEVRKLILLLNEQQWIGHFGIWLPEGMIMYRHGLLLSDTTVTNKQCEVMLQMAHKLVERYYPAFQAVVWAGKTAEEALADANFETSGEA